MKQYGKYFASLVGLYIIVANGSGFGTAFTAGANGLATVTKQLQGPR